MWDYLLTGTWLRDDPVAGLMCAVFLMAATPWRLAVSGPYRFFVAMFAKHEGTAWRELYDEEVRACGLPWFNDGMEI